MVVIRLARGGAKKQPFYHVVAADKRRARDSKYLEKLGYYNPVARGQAVRIELNQERIDHWVKLGAQPSDRVKRLIKDFAKGDTAAKPAREHKAAPAPKVEEKAEEVKAEADAPAAEAKAEDGDKAAE